MITGKIDKLKELEIFNTPYKIKLKGIVKSQGSIDSFILETHGKIYALTPSLDKFIFNEELDKAADFEEEFPEAILFFKYNKELIVEDSEKFKSNIFSIKTIERTFYDRRTCSVKKVLSKELLLNNDIQKELDDNRHLYGVDRFTFIRDLYGIKNETLDDIIETKKVLTEMMEEMEKFERIKIKSSMRDYTKLTTELTGELTKLANNLESILTKNTNKDNDAR